jgi:hypothetical protein
LKKISRYIVAAVLLLILFSSCTQNNRQLPSLEETYRHTDTQPFGSFIAYKGLKSEFADYWINIADEPFNDTWRNLQKDNDSTYSLYFLITKNLVVSNEEGNAMVDFVKAGNDLFISADFIDHKLLDALNCSVNRKDEIIHEVNGKMQNTSISISYGKDMNSRQYGYFYFPFLNYFNSYDTTMTRVLGVNEIGLPDYIVLFAGKGRLYLQLAPRAFSNYFLLTDNNYHYFEAATAYLRFEPQYVYWDEYYNSFSSTRDKNSFRNGSDFSSFKVIKENPPLLWAFYIGLACVLLFIIFNIKRKQREIPVVKPLKNATVDFAATIGRLYLQQKNNRDVAEKIITYFYEYLRKKYFIQTDNFNKEFIDTVARKSGIGKNETTELFDCIQRIRSQEEVSDEDVLLLNQKVENFKK